MFNMASLLSGIRILTQTVLLLCAYFFVLTEQQVTDLLLIHGKDEPNCRVTIRLNVTCLSALQAAPFFWHGNEWPINTSVHVIDYSETSCVQACSWAQIHFVAMFIKMSWPAPCACTKVEYPVASTLLQVAMNIFREYSSSKEIVVLYDTVTDLHIPIETFVKEHDFNHISALRLFDIRGNISFVCEENCFVIITGDCFSLATALKSVEKSKMFHISDIVVIHMGHSVCHLEHNLSYVYITAETPSIADAMKGLEGNKQDTKLEDLISMGFLPEISLQFSNNSVTKTKVGSWTAENGFKNVETIFAKTPRKFLKIVTIHDPPFVIREELSNGAIAYKGYTIDVLNFLAKQLQFQYTLYEVPDGQYGVLLPNNTWTGVIGEVAYGKADMAAGSISVTTERDTVIDFTAPYYDYAGLQLLVKGEEKTKQMFVFMNVFAGDTWCLWFAVLFVTAFVVYAFHKIRDKVFQVDYEHGRKDIMTFSLKDSVWFAISSVPLAGPDKIPNTPSVRLFVSGFWFFCQIIMASYTANLAAFLTSSRLEAPLEDLDDLISNSQFQYSVQAGSVSEKYFSRMADIEENFYVLWRNMSYISNDDTNINRFSIWDYPLKDTYASLWKNMIKTGFVKTSEEGIKKTLAGNFAFFHESPMITYEMGRTCGLMTVGPVFSAKPYAFVLPPTKTHILEQFAFEVLHLQSGTLMKELKQKWWENTSLQCNKDSHSTSLSMNTLGGVFIVISTGGVLSVVLLIIENAIKKCQKRCRRLPTKPVYSKTESTVALAEYTNTDMVQAAGVSTSQDIMHTL